MDMDMDMDMPELDKKTFHKEHGVKIMEFWCRC